MSCCYNYTYITFLIIYSIEIKIIIIIEWVKIDLSECTNQKLKSLKNDKGSIESLETFF